MTSKEKAQELFDKMHWAMPHQSTTNAETYIISKRCALIAVEEIIKIIPYEKRQRAFMDAYYRDNTSYWIEVKQEIESL